MLCQDSAVGDVTLADVDHKLASLVKKIVNEELRTEIELRILNNERFIKRRFVRFIMDHIEPSFWNTDRPDDQWMRMQEDQLEKFLKCIYDQRSNALHTGEPFAPGIFLPPMGEVNGVVARVVEGNKKRTKLQCIPYPWFFERLVNHVLRVYLRRHLIGVK